MDFLRNIIKSKLSKKLKLYNFDISINNGEDKYYKVDIQIDNKQKKS